MFAQLANVLSRLGPVHVARTDEERQAVYRLRYDVIVAEQGGALLGVDHARREVRTPEDDLPESTLYYVGSPSRMTGALRVRAWGPGRIPRDFHQQYSLERFPDIDSRAICNVAFLAAHPSIRGTTSVVALTAGALEQTVAQHGAEAMFAECSPGLLRRAARFGLRAYGGRPISSGRGMSIPMIGITADLDHARRCDSPWTPALEKLAAKGRLPRGDYASLLAPLARGGVESNTARIIWALEGAARREPSKFLGVLSPEARSRLGAEACILDVDPEVVVLAPDAVSRDLFVVLEGALQVEVDGRIVRALGPGDVFGEVAFFRASGRRSATVVAAAKSRVLLVRHRAIHRMKASHPGEALAIVEALAGALAERLAERR